MPDGLDKKKEQFRRTAPFVLLVHGELLADVSHSCVDFCLGTFKVTGSQADAVGNALHLLFAQTAGGHSGSADTDTGSHCRLLRIVGDGILVQGDMVGIAADLQFLAGDVHGPQVSKHQMVVGAAGDQVEALFQQSGGHSLGVLHDVLSIGLELGLHSFLQADGLGSDDVLQRAALGAGENAGIQLLGKFLTCQDQTAAGATESLVGCSSDNIRIRRWQNCLFAG